MEEEIGREARRLDKKSIFERMKVDNRSILRLLGALLVYCIIMFLFQVIL